MSATMGTETKALTKAKEPTIGEMLALPAIKSRLAEVATKHLPPEKLIRIVTGEMRRVPKLGECTPASFMNCVLNLSRLGLEPGGPVPQAHLIPYEDKKRGIVECTLQLDFRGLQTLARRSGKIRRLEAHVVYANDGFVWRQGLTPALEHTPTLSPDRGEVIAAYMVAELVGDGVQVEVMTRADIDKVRAMSKAGHKPGAPWDQHFDEMARKTVFRRGAKWLPLSAEEFTPLRDALTIDNEEYAEALTAGEQRRERLPPRSLRDALSIAPQQPDDPALIARMNAALAPGETSIVCDGEHAAPVCGDPQCWGRDT